MEIGLTRGKVEQLEWLRTSARRSVVIEEELALVIWPFEDALMNVSDGFKA